ncbi:hypothetical protein D3C87_1281940 [compost metagenome]
MCDKIAMKDINEFEKLSNKIDQDKREFFREGMKDVILSREQIEVARKSIRKGK